jgi:hypothetical protein
VTVDIFSKNVIRTNIINTYVATAFFATVIFFVINGNSYTPLEMTFAVVIVTIAFKGIANIMLSLIILLFSFDEKKDSIEFENAADKIDGLINDLNIKDANKSAS